jgi:hypothetical protein
LIKEETKKQIQELKSESDKIKTQYYDILKKRRDLKKIISKDMGCDCEGNCRKELYDWPLGAGQQHEYCHDDADKADVRVLCKNGEIEVITSAAVWWTYTEINRTILRTGQTWSTQIPEQDEWHDQTNRVQIIGRAPSSLYDLNFMSHD